MANPEHLDVIRKGVQVWNQWREEYPEVLPDLSAVDFLEEQLEIVIDLNRSLRFRVLRKGTDLRRANLSYTNLEGALLINVNLSDADLTEANLTGVYFSGAKLNGAILRAANVNEVVFAFTNLSGADLSGVDLRNIRDARIVESNLRGANLSRVHLENIDLRTVSLAVADLSNAILNNANLMGVDLRGANLSSAKLNGAILGAAKLNNALLVEADVSGAGLGEADLSDANLNGTNLTASHFKGADLSNATLNGATLFETHFTGANVSNTDFSKSWFGWTYFAGVDLSTAVGLDTVFHIGPTIISIDTIYKSHGRISEFFLRRAGIPNSFLNAIPALVKQPLEFYTCFISYSTRDQRFVERLYADLQDKGVRCWFAPKNLKIGDKVRAQIDQAIRLYDRLLIVLSEHSVASQWVEQEVEAALEREREEKRVVLFPIRLDNAVMEMKEGWPASVRRTRVIGDFTLWEQPENYQQTFDHLLHDLEAK